MADLFKPNDGSRPSQLALGQMHTGETERVEGEPLAAFEAELAAATQALPAFDFAVLSAASHRVDDATPQAEAPVVASGAPWWRTWLIFPAGLLALMMATVVLPPDALENRVKGGETDLGYYLMRRGRVLPGVEKAPLAAGDRIQFTYRADLHETLVLINVDGNGDMDVFYPEDGQEPVAVLPTGRHVLEDSFVLDDAPGPETFVAVFGPGSVDEAMALVRAAYDAGGHPALEALEVSDPAVATVVIDKKDAK